MAYRMTAARKRALRKAQLISARVRRRMGNVKMNRGHKRVVGALIAGSAVVGGAYATNKLMDAHKLALSNANRARARQRVVNRRNNRINNAPDMTRTRAIGDVLEGAAKGGNAAPNWVVQPGKMKKIIRIRNSASDAVKALLLEQRGQPVVGRFAGTKGRRVYKVQYGDYEMTGVDDDNNPIWEWKPTSKPM